MFIQKIIHSIGSNSKVNHHQKTKLTQLEHAYTVNYLQQRRNRQI